MSLGGPKKKTETKNFPGLTEMSSSWNGPAERVQTPNDKPIATLLWSLTTLEVKNYNTPLGENGRSYIMDWESGQPLIYWH